MVLGVVLLVLEVVLVVLEVTGPQVPWGIFQIRLSLRPDLYSPAPPISKTIKFLRKDTLLLQKHVNSLGKTRFCCKNNENP